MPASALPEVNRHLKMDPMQELLRLEAVKWDIEVVEPFDQGSLLFIKDDREVLFSEGFPLNLISVQSERIIDNKQFTKRYFEKAGIYHPESLTFHSLNRQSESDIKNFWQSGQVYVCKPLNALNGEGVQMHVSDYSEIQQYWLKWKDKFNTFMLEEQVEGKDLRIQAIGGKVVAACTRVPAYVIGDGNSLLNELIERRQLEVARQNPLNQLVIDEDSIELLNRQQMQLDSIPSKGQKIQLKYVANMAQGGVAVDVTDKLHPKYAESTKKLAELLDISIFALDLITTDYSEEPTFENSWAIEINAKPQWLHHTFSERRTHPIPEKILKLVFDL